MATIHMSPPTGRAQLEEFIFHPDQFRTEDIPRNLSAEEVAEFLRSRIGIDTPLKALAQALKVVDFYDLHEICSHYKAIYQRLGTKPEDFGRSVVVARTLALVCSTAELSFVGQSFASLVNRAAAPPDFRELIWLSDALGTMADLQPLKKRLADRLKTLESQKSDYQAELEYHKLEEIKNLTLERSEKAKGVEDKILRIADRRQRINEEIKAYLTLGYGFLEFVQPWAGRRLRREVWADQPEQQTVRADDPVRRQQLAQEFRQAGEEIKKNPDVPEESKPSLRVRCLRAVVFFGGSLSQEENDFVKEHAGRQWDLLSKE